MKSAIEPLDLAAPTDSAAEPPPGLSLASGKLRLTARRQEIVDELRGLAATGIAPRARDLLPAHADLVQRVRRNFRGFPRARRMAGVPVDEPTTVEALADELRALANLGVPITASGLRAVGEKGLLHLCHRLLGGMGEAQRTTVKAASEEEVLAELRAVIATQSRPPPFRQLPRPLAREVIRRFRTYRVALARLGLSKTPAAWTQRWLVSSLLELHRRGVRLTASAVRRHSSAVGEMLDAYPGGPDAALVLAERARVVDELRVLAAAGVPPRADTLLPAHVDLVQRASKYHRGLMSARRAARLPVDPPVSAVDLLGRLAVVATSYPITAHGLSHIGDRDLVRQCLVHFGSIRQARLRLRMLARERRGEAKRVQRREAQRLEVISRLQQLASCGVVIVPRGMRAAGHATLLRRCYDVFGSIHAAREAAGLDQPPRTRRAPAHSRRETLDALRLALAHEDGLPPMRKDLAPSLRRSIVGWFGTYRAALAELGVKPRGNKKWTRVRVIAALTEIHCSGIPLRASRLQRDRADLANAIIRHVGSFREAFAIVQGEQTGRARAGRRATAGVIRRGVRCTPTSAAERQIKRAFATALASLRSNLEVAARAIAAETLAAWQDRPRRGQ